ncbi:hypothetical protein QCA50_018284 [Cerrena zonata]|uniref:Uncharacterized protein n=1 Tax=Cerrena zonata TaxID=2478898 RepID=A0AAW0FN45_9APHY
MSSKAGSSNGVEVTETEPLLRARVPTTGNYGIGRTDGDSDGDVEEVLIQGNTKDLDEENVEDEIIGIPGNSTNSVADVPGEKKRLGAISAAFLIFNRVIGTGIFATPSVILRSSGSVGLSLVLWLIGALVAACGTAVYIELGTGIPRNGGEKNYLEFIYRRPRFLTTCTYAMYAVLVGWSSASTSVFGEYVLHAINPTHTPSTLAVRLISLLAITSAFLLHGSKPGWGLKLQNTLGVFKLLILAGMALSGLAVLAGVPGFHLDDPPKNFEWNTMWKGSLSGGANAFVTGMYNVIWSFIGYSNANYSLSEVKNPVRSMKIAAPLAMISISIVYFLVNIAYFAVVSKEEILGSGRIAAALFFGRLWGPQTERILSGVVAMSILGNILAVLFSMGRVVQELGKEGILPFSSFFASNKPFGAPMAGLFEQWAINSLLVAFVPAGDAYHFMLNLSTYPCSLINMTVSGGLLLLKSSVLKYEWDPPFKSWWFTTCLFFLSNIFLVVAPWIPPARGFQPYETLPYWASNF